MSATTYQYLVTDTANNLVASDALKQSIEKESGITIQVNGVSYNTTHINIEFADALPGTQKADHLDGLVTAHTGEKLIYPDEVIVDSSPPFAAKVLPNGKKLFSRVKGEEYSLSAGSNTLDFAIPYPQVKFNELEIIGCELGDNATLRIKDDASGTYSTVPNYTLNTFGENVYMAKDYYHRASSYDADLYYGMRIYIEFESESAKTVYVNYILHELKD